MSTFDTVVVTFISRYCIPVLIFIGLALLVLKNAKYLKNSIFSRFLAKFESSYGTVTRKYKEELFSSLFFLQSYDWKLRNDGCIRILELGVRTGENLQFYPNNSKVILVDKNIHVSSYFKSHHDKLSHIKVDDIIVSSGERLPSITSNSIDVVVSTLFLCSAVSIDRVLKEVRRILAPTGKLFFLEHVRDRPGTFLCFIQTMLSASGFWPAVFDGCNLNRDIAQNIRVAGFSDVNFKLVALKDTNIPLLRFMKSHIVGTAQKKE